MFESIFAALDAQGFSIFMIGWIVCLFGALTHMIGGGFRDGSSKVPVLGNWAALQKGDKGYVQQIVAAWIFRFGGLIIIVGGALHFF